MLASHFSTSTPDLRVADADRRTPIFRDGAVRAMTKNWPPPAPASNRRPSPAEKTPELKKQKFQIKPVVAQRAKPFGKVHVPEDVAQLFDAGHQDTSSSSSSGAPSKHQSSTVSLAPATVRSVASDHTSSPVQMLAQMWASRSATSSPDLKPLPQRAPSVPINKPLRGEAQPPSGESSLKSSKTAPKRAEDGAHLKKIESSEPQDQALVQSSMACQSSDSLSTDKSQSVPLPEQLPAVTPERRDSDGASRSAAGPRRDSLGYALPEKKKNAEIKAKPPLPPKTFTKDPPPVPEKQQRKSGNVSSVADTTKNVPVAHLPPKVLLPAGGNSPNDENKSMGSCPPSPQFRGQHENLVKDLASLYDDIIQKHTSVPLRREEATPKMTLRADFLRPQSTSPSTKMSSTPTQNSVTDIVSRYRRLPLPQVDLNSPPENSLETKPSLPPRPARPSRTAEGGAPADTEDDFYEDVAAASEAAAKLNEHIRGKSLANADTGYGDSDALYDMPVVLDGLDRNENNSQINGSFCSSGENDRAQKADDGSNKQDKDVKPADQLSPKERKQLRKAEEKKRREEEKQKQKKAKENAKRQEKELKVQKEEARKREKEQKKQEKKKDKERGRAQTTADASRPDAAEQKHHATLSSDKALNVSVENAPATRQRRQLSNSSSADDAALNGTSSSTFSPCEHANPKMLFLLQKEPGQIMRSQDDSGFVSNPAEKLRKMRGHGSAINLFTPKEAPKAVRQTAGGMYKISENRRAISATCLQHITEHSVSEFRPSNPPNRNSMPSVGSYGSQSGGYGLSPSDTDDLLFDHPTSQTRSPSIGTSASRDSWGNRLASAYIEWADEKITALKAENGAGEDLYQNILPEKAMSEDINGDRREDPALPAQNMHLPGEIYDDDDDDKSATKTISTHSRPLQSQSSSMSVTSDTFHTLSQDSVELQKALQENKHPDKESHKEEQQKTASHKVQKEAERRQKKAEEEEQKRRQVEQERQRKAELKQAKLDAEKREKEEKKAEEEEEKKRKLLEEQEKKKALREERQRAVDERKAKKDAQRREKEEREALRRQQAKEARKKEKERKRERQESQKGRRELKHISSLGMSTSITSLTSSTASDPHSPPSICSNDSLGMSSDSMQHLRDAGALGGKLSREGSAANSISSSPMYEDHQPEEAVHNDFYMACEEDDEKVQAAPAKTMPEDIIYEAVSQGGISLTSSTRPEEVEQDEGDDPLYDVPDFELDNSEKQTNTMEGELENELWSMMSRLDSIGSRTDAIITRKMDNAHSPMPDGSTELRPSSTEGASSGEKQFADDSSSMQAQPDLDDVCVSDISTQANEDRDMEELDGQQWTQQPTGYSENEVIYDEATQTPPPDEEENGDVEYVEVDHAGEQEPGMPVPGAKKMRPLSVIIEEKSIDVVLSQVDANGRFRERGIDVEFDDGPPAAIQPKKPAQLPAPMKKKKSILNLIGKSKSQEDEREDGPERKPKDEVKKKKVKEPKLKSGGFSTSKLITRQQKYFKLTGNEKTLYVAMAKHTCTTGPDLYLTYEAGELFSVLFTTSNDKREIPEDSLLVRREADGTYGFVEVINMARPTDLLAELEDTAMQDSSYEHPSTVPGLYNSIVPESYGRHDAGMMSQPGVRAQPTHVF